MENNDEMNVEEMEKVAGGAGSNSDFVELDGTVVAFADKGYWQVDIGGQTVVAEVSAKLRMNFIRIKIGDRVRVAYDPSLMRGKITWRYK